MSDVSMNLLASWAKRPFHRRSLLGAFVLTLVASSSIGKAFGISTPVITQVLGRPTGTTVALSVLSSENITAYLEYGYSKTSYSGKSGKLNLTPAMPVVFEIAGLKANTRTYYRLRFTTADSKVIQAGKQYSFTTQRKTGSTFTFSVQGDTHPERAGLMFNSELYYVTMANIEAQQPDFHIMLGDDFSIDPIISRGQANQAGVEKIYSTHRTWLATAARSVPLFLVNGNHEQAAAYLLDGSATNPAILAGNARLKYFPLPTKNGFYSVDKNEVPNVGLLGDYYSWTWGDALFITLDPYWHSKSPVDNAAGVVVPEDQGVNSSAAGARRSPAPRNTQSPLPAATSTPVATVGRTLDLWTIGLGDEQYMWLKQTLESSTAKYKFIFAHHVMGTGRGAVEVSTNYEWGGVDPKGKTTFAKERPNWELPIHDLMVKNKVSIFFQGHDHIFVTQERDGLIYQSMPNPADDTFTWFNEAAYKSGVKAANSGHVRVTVSPAEAKVEYFLAARPQDTVRKNLDLAHSYSVRPKI